MTLTFTGEIDLLSDRVLDLVSITRLQSSKCYKHITHLHYALAVLLLVDKTATYTIISKILSTSFFCVTKYNEM